jgi:hypothetical protein
MNPWIIDKDLLAMGKPGTFMNAVGVSGPHGYKGDGSELFCKFLMYDDDGVLYYEGRAKEVGFEPLDNFGTPNSGCTSIKFLNPKTDEWEVL